ncbi:hypothetical protein AB4Y90_16705 [Chryseobacterium sp. 2TAF14]|uniref:hypothetical protein n=1 Tax=Chryseobacterium sp. 2TAF14 TaxID=3233007 RepID=UPI003F8E4CB4
MKKTLFLIGLISYQIYFSQIGISAASPNAFYESLYFKNFKYEYKDIKGSPYANMDFQLAQIGDYKDVPVRYNSYTDSFEFKQNGANYILPKEDNLSTIIFQNRNKKYILTNIGDNKQYLEEIDKEVGLYKKTTTIFKEFKKAVTNYEQDFPATFEQVSPKYYWLNNNNMIEVSKKNIEKSFPQSQKRLRDFIRKNSLSYDKEQDLVKIVSFLQNNQ